MKMKLFACTHVCLKSLPLFNGMHKCCHEGIQALTFLFAKFLRDRAVYGIVLWLNIR